MTTIKNILLLQTHVTLVINIDISLQLICFQWSHDWIAE